MGVINNFVQFMSGEPKKATDEPMHPDVEKRAENVAREKEKEKAANSHDTASQDPPHADWANLSEEEIRRELEKQMREIEESMQAEIGEFEQRIKEFEQKKIEQAHAQEEQVRQHMEQKLAEVKEAKRRAEEERVRRIEEARKKAEEERRRREEEKKKAAEEAEQKKREEQLRVKELELQQSQEPVPVPAQPPSPPKEDVLQEEVKPMSDIVQEAAPTAKDDILEEAADQDGGPDESSFLNKLSKVGITVDDEVQKAETAHAHAFRKRVRLKSEGGISGGSGEGDKGSSMPGSDNILNVDVFRSPAEFILIAQLPGVALEDLEVLADKALDTVIIKAEKKVPANVISEDDEEKGGYIIQDVSWGPVYRKIVLPEEIDVYAAYAKLIHGVLIMRLPLLRAEEQGSEQRKIKVIQENT